MASTLFLLDGMALVYRAHFALIQRPIRTSQGLNTSALHGFAQTLLELREMRRPTHLALVFDTPVPTRRHQEYPAYKAQREAMPEELSQALPHVRRLAEAFRVRVLALDGYEADDVIGTLVRRAERDGLDAFMVTPDKDFGQLVTPRVRLYRPGRTGGEPEILGPEEICARWGIREPGQLIDILGLMGDASDNIPGVPGIGEKTAVRLVAEHGSLEAVLARAETFPGKLRENLLIHRDQALLSKRLATIDCDVPLECPWDDLKVQPPDDVALRRLLVEFEFNALGRRLYGPEFKAGHGSGPTGAHPVPTTPRRGPKAENSAGTADGASSPVGVSTGISLRSREVRTPAEGRELVRQLSGLGEWGVAALWTGPDPRRGQLHGLAFALGGGSCVHVQMPPEPSEARLLLDCLRPVLEAEEPVKVGFDLKAEVAVLRRHGVALRGLAFDAMLAHALVEPELRHSFDYVAESQLGWRLQHRPEGSGRQAELGLGLPEVAPRPEAALERADAALRLRRALDPKLAASGQQGVFAEVEMPLIEVLVDMEGEGIRVEVAALAEFSAALGREMAEQERWIHQLAGETFNVNSPKQLGEILFERLRLVDQARKTRTGQYATDEQTLAALAGDHEIVRRLLDYRACSKLKSTYADALPAAVDPATGRVHTTFQQLMASTGRLSSQNPNLQNIPIRTDRGQEVRRAFVPRAEGWALLSADYSQIELRIIAALAREAGLLEAFRLRLDVHAATAARVFGVRPEAVTPEMRKQAKMVNYGIAYGISAFGLAQRLGIPRKAAAEIMESYFAQFPGIRGLMERTIASCRELGYASTVTGRRRPLPEIRSANGTVRAAAERNAINMPIQGTAADMIKLAMIRLHRALRREGLKSRLLLQVHDELVFDLWLPEEATLRALVEEAMRTALPLEVPIEVEVGVGANWLEAH